MAPLMTYPHVLMFVCSQLYAPRGKSLGRREVKLSQVLPFLSLTHNANSFNTNRGRLHILKEQGWAVGGIGVEWEGRGGGRASGIGISFFLGFFGGKQRRAGITGRSHVHTMTTQLSSQDFTAAALVYCTHSNVRLCVPPSLYTA